MVTSGGVGVERFASMPSARAAGRPTPSTALEVNTVRRRSLSRLVLFFRYALEVRSEFFFITNDYTANSNRLLKNLASLWRIFLSCQQRLYNK